MKKLILIAIVLTGCSSIDFEARMPDENGENGYCEINYKKVGKSEIQGLNASICGGSLGVDKSTTDTPSGVSLEAVACILAPHLCIKE